MRPPSGRGAKTYAVAAVAKLANIHQSNPNRANGIQQFTLAFDAVQMRDLETAIDKLPQEQRQAILLVGPEGRYDELAVVLGVSIGTVRSRLSRGRDSLRKLMGMDEEMSSQPVARFSGAMSQPEAA